MLPRLVGNFGLASGAVKAGVSVFRVSGPKVPKVWSALSRGATLPPARHACLRKLYDWRDNTLLDYGLVMRFESPHSFTGEDTLELQVHGAPSIQHAVANVLASLARPAEAGEFTRRAFDNGKLDLLQVESLADLIESETKSQRLQALHQLSGKVDAVYSSWRTGLIRLLANIEAFIDFAEDDEIQVQDWSQLAAPARTILDEIKGHLNDAERGEKIRNGLRGIFFPQCFIPSFVNLLFYQ